MQIELVSEKSNMIKNVIQLVIVATSCYFMGRVEVGRTITSTRIELVNKRGERTVSLDGEARTLTIYDASGRSECIRLGPWVSAYVLRMRTADTRRGGICLVAGQGEGSIILGSDGEDLLPSKSAIPFWALNAKSGKSLDFVHYAPEESGRKVVHQFAAGE